MGVTSFLRDVIGVIHVGANTGQEREKYNRHDLDVVWIEPIPHIVEQLRSNIKPYPKQQAFQRLVTDTNDKTYDFHIASNGGASSSILEFGADFNTKFSNIHYTQTITLRSVTLETFVNKENIDMSKYDSLVIDTQGTELLVLTGAASLLHHFKYIWAEAANFSLYEGCCIDEELKAFLTPYGFNEIYRRRYPFLEERESFDIIFKKQHEIL